MSIASVSIRNPVFAWMLMLGFIVFGYIGFQRLPVGQYPDVDFPLVTINAILEGASPEIMESDVADVLEDAVMAVEGIRELSSVCKQGQATVTVEFDLARNVDLALQDIQARVSQATKQLPKDMDPVTINKTNPEENPIMWVALSGTRSQQEISEYAKNVLRDRFLTVEGNGDVTMGGYLQRNVRIWLRPQALEAYALSADDVIKAFQREHVEVPAGRLEGSMRESNVRVEGEALNVGQIRNILITTRNGSPIYVKDVALVEDGFEDRRRIARANGFPAQGLGIIKQHGSNTVEVAEAVHQRIRELRKTLPENLSLDVRVDNSKFIKEAVHEIEFTLIMAVLLTALVCWLFLGSLSSTLNVVLAIPVSVFGTFSIMYFAGFSLNTFTLLALSLSIGIVVDDAVMVMENIYRHAEMGKGKMEAAKDGAEQITFAAFASTLAIVAIFLPVAFMTGIIGKFFFQFGVVLSVAVSISLLEALTLAPARCSQFLRVGHRTNMIERAAGVIFFWLAARYRGALSRILNFRTGLSGKIIGSLAAMASLALSACFIGLAVPLLGSQGFTALTGVASLYLVLGVIGICLTVALSALVFSSELYPTGSTIVLGLTFLVFAGSLVFAYLLPKEMVPAQDQGYYMVRVVTPVGSTVDYTDKVMHGVEEILATHDEIESTLVIAGGISGDVNAGLAFVTLKPQNQRKNLSQQQSIAQLNAQIEKQPFPGSRILPLDMSQAGFASAKRGGLSIEYSIRGKDWETLGGLAEGFMEEMKKSGLFVGVDTDYRRGMPEVQVIPDREKAMAQNVDMKTLADTVASLVGGAKIGRFKDNGRRYDVRIRLLKEGRSRPEDIGDLFIRAKDGKLVRLSDVASISSRPSLQSIMRQNRERSVTLMANPAPGHSQAEALQAIEALGKEKLPEGYSIYFSGSSKAFRESFDSLQFALILGLIVAYMVLASQFNSFIHPVTVLIALPFSISGALAALYFTHQSLNVYSMIGLILLMGIVKKNSILLVDYTNHVRAMGRERDEALIEACPTRLRPILMTTVATIAGALPVALSLGPGGELLVPMATAIIGGLTLSTALTLFVVPCFYSLVDELKTKLAKLLIKTSTSAGKQSSRDADCIVE